LHLHIGEERRPGEHGADFIIRLEVEIEIEVEVEVEEAEVRVLTDDSVKLSPLPFPLQPLRTP
jgi:hypothetical protein